MPDAPSSSHAGEHVATPLPEWLRAEYPFGQHSHLLDSGHRMNYVDHGQGEPVLLLHGNPTWSYFYRKTILALAGKGFRCIAPDHIGCGFSDKPQDYRYTLANHIGNLENLVSKLGLEGVHLVVHDWGGAIGFGWATRNVSKLRSLTVLNTAAFRSKHIPLRIAVCKIPCYGEFIVRQFNAFAGLGTTMAVEKPLPKDVARGFTYPYGNYADRIATARFVRDIPMHPGHPSWETLAGIEQKLPGLTHLPMQIHWGMKDWCFSPRFLEKWKQFFPAAKVQEYATAGHYLLEDEGSQILPALVDFLEKS